MLVRTSVERDTVLRGWPSDSQGAAGQVRPRKGGFLSQSTSRDDDRRVAPPTVIQPADRPSHAQDLDSVNIFQPYFWLVFDDPNVRKRHPETKANGQIVVNVADLPRSDGNIGVEEIMRGLGIFTTEGEDPYHEPPPPTEAEPFKPVGDVPPAGYKKLDVRVEWSRTSLLSSALPLRTHITFPFFSCSIRCHRVWPERAFTAQTPHRRSAPKRTQNTQLRRCLGRL